MSENMVSSKKLLSVLVMGMFMLAGPMARAAVSVPKYPKIDCFKEVCASYFEDYQGVYVSIMIPGNAQINLGHGSYGSLWAIAIANGHEIGRSILSEARAGYLSTIPLGRNFSGQFEIYIENSKGGYYSNFGQNFQFTINRP
ncbi:MAG: hypothetical protein J0M15_05335 [Deltaproteobacteria bacterium]|jgi:hypothetical protein|nr:hypothetical protein [Deltaproteobacteria bacterium]